MRVVFGPIPPSQSFQNGRENWTPLRELESKWFVGVALLMAVPFVAVVIFLVRNASGYLKAEPVALWSLVTFFVAIGAILRIPACASSLCVVKERELYRHVAGPCHLRVRCSCACVPARVLF